MNFGRVACSGLLVAILVSSARADVAGDLKSARDNLQHGRYAQALEAYTLLADSAKDSERVEPVIGRSQTLMETGQYDEAEKQLAAAVDQLPDDPRLRAGLELESRQGRTLPTSTAARRRARKA